MGNVQDAQANPESNGNGNLAPTPPSRPSRTGGTPTSPMYPPLNDGDHDYEILKPPYPVGPSRPAPRPPAVSHQSSTDSMKQISHALDGVPFVINPRFITSASADKFPVIKAKTLQQIMREYDYPFTVERQTLT